jgi:apolipoprotein N-acyltransferase
VQRSTRFIFTIVSALIAGVTGFLMYQKYQEQTLWGYWPLLLFLTGWLTLAGLVGRKSLSLSRGPRWLLMASVSGVLLSAGFPPLPTTPLMFLGFVPLFWLTKEIIESDEPKPLKRLFFFGYHTFAVWNILTTYWVANTAFVAGVFAIFVNALFMCVPLVLAVWTLRKIPRFGFLIFIAYWLSFEYLHLRWEISWPWLNLGNAFAAHPSWVQWYEYTGTFGGSLWILLTNLLLFRYLWSRRTTPEDRGLRTLLQTGALIFLPIIFSLVQYQQRGEVTTPGVEVAIIQPNYEPHYQKFDIPEDDQLEQFLALSRSAVTENTDYLIFPETSFGPTEDLRLGEEPITRQLKEFIDNYPRLKLVSGLTVFHVLQADEEASPATRRIERPDGRVTEYEMINAAVQFESQSDSVMIYKKSKLVPGAEFLPYKKFFFFLEPLVDKLEGSMAGYALQDRRSSFAAANGTTRVGPAICYESIYGEYYAEYVRAGANVTFIMTNDGWWDNTAGHRQHLQFASLRAIETRKPIARSANTGISAFINARGDILAPTEYGVAAAISGEIHPSDEVTFYVLWGDLIGRIAGFLSAIFFLNSLVKRFQPAKPLEN